MTISLSSSGESLLRPDRGLLPRPPADNRYTKWDRIRRISASDHSARLMATRSTTTVC